MPGTFLQKLGADGFFNGPLIMNIVPFSKRAQFNKACHANMILISFPYYMYAIYSLFCTLLLKFLIISSQSAVRSYMNSHQSTAKTKEVSILKNTAKSQDSIACTPVHALRLCVCDCIYNSQNTNYIVLHLFSSYIGNQY